MTPRTAPGDGRTGHLDTFARDHLPPRDLWPVMDWSGVPDLAACPDRLNVAAALLDDAITRGWGDRPAIRCGDAVWRYRDVQAAADAIARVLVEDMGLVAGNRVLLHGWNTPMMAAAWFAILKAGGINVATMPLLRAREIAFIVEKARVEHCLCDVTLAGEVERAREMAPRLRHVRSFSALGTDPGRAALDAAITRKAPGFEAADTSADDTALIAFTSGTTGQAKGTMHFHRDILAMCDCFPRYVYQPHRDDVYLGTPPLAFTFGLGAQLCFPFRFGSSVVYAPGPPSPERLLEHIERERVTTLYTAPMMYRALAELIPQGRYDISSLRQCVSAGETLPLPFFQGFLAATGIRIMDGLGSTEMLHIFVSSSGEETRPGATGKAIFGYTACIVDGRGEILAPPCEGLLATRGPTGCRYLDDEDRQRTYVRNGWNLPGDRYRQDADGYFWYVARADDMIVSAGYNIGGPEVEAVLLEHPLVKECAVVGAPDAERGRIVKAFIVLRDPTQAGEPAVRELQAFVKEQIAPYKYPRAIEFVGNLPRTETGKVQRFRLRQAEEEKARALGISVRM